MIWRNLTQHQLRSTAQDFKMDKEFIKVLKEKYGLKQATHNSIRKKMIEVFGFDIGDKNG